VKIWKFILSPLGLLYGGVVFVRNMLYDWGFLKTHPILGKSIVVGNLSMGGTGKSPHTLYLWNLLKDNYAISFLSRGYGRKTKGLHEVTINDNSFKVGDEPLMFKRCVGDKSRVVVSESRLAGVKYIRLKEANSVVLLDDAFQHRKIKAGMYILLTDYQRPYYKDYIFPVGFLREWRLGKKRADILVVSKCPTHLSSSEKDNICSKLKFPFKGNIFFSHLVYKKVVSLFDDSELLLTKGNIKTILLVAGIANPQPLLYYLQPFARVESLFFSDHYNFTTSDIIAIHKKFDTFDAHSSVIITTEKDSVRLTNLLVAERDKSYPWYYQSIEVQIDRHKEFNTLITDYVEEN